MNADAPPLLRAVDVSVRFGRVQAARGVSLEIGAGEALGLVGESGSGKSVTARAIVRLLRPEAALVAGALHWRGRDLRAMDAAALRRLRAREIALVVQDPGAALNPVLRVGTQIARIHARVHGDPAAARRAALAMLRRLRVPDAESRMQAYPHQLSGGLKQRVLLAMALVCRPALLVADEPTTALDATVAAGILRLLAELRAEMGLSVLLISHDLAAVARLCDRVAVMYAGRIVETGPTAALLAAPRHPYTTALLGAVPRGGKSDGPLTAVPGEPPDLSRLPPGCPFVPRCPLAAAPCVAEQPLRPLSPGRGAACWRAAA